ncbi:MobF family relaxase [Streptomyces sp. NPDC006682]|uniref:MobF family relaxase n=1 Tax=unclassified Streptomyces TaxID=2593676 RepID=UPI00345609CA
MKWKDAFDRAMEELKAIRALLAPVGRLDDPTAGLIALHGELAQTRLKILETVQGGITGLREENREVRRRQDRMISDLNETRGELRQHPDADRIEADRLAAGDCPRKAFKAGALGRRVTVTGVDFVFRPQPAIYLLWALGDEETRRVIEAAHERAIARVLEWIEDEVAVIRYGKDGNHRVRPPGGLVAARFRHYEARSGMPLLHDHLLPSVKGQRLDGKWGSIHTTALPENTVAASALYNELVAAEVCGTLGLATEPRTVTPGHRPVMEIAGVPHELIRWTARRSDQIAACMKDLEHEYVTAVDDDGEPRLLPVVSERARTKLNQIAARKTRPPKQKTQPLAQLRAWWKASAILPPPVSPPPSSTTSSSTPAPRPPRSGPASRPWSTWPWRPSTSRRRCS